MERQERAADLDALTTRIGQAVMLLHGGDREEARGRFLALWAEVGPDGDPLHRCTLAHYLADAQDDPADELAWDLRALSAAQELTGRRPVPRRARLAARAFSPSLHLGLAADYAGLGDQELARGHLRQARAAADVLVDGDYAAAVRAAISRLERRLDDRRQDG